MTPEEELEVPFVWGEKKENVLTDEDASLIGFALHQILSKEESKEESPWALQGRYDSHNRW